MGNTVGDGLLLARKGEHPGLICQMPSGWLVLADMQYLKGYCILLADPVVASLNDLDEGKRVEFLADMAVVGDALLKVTGVYRINYAVMGNSDPFLHAHIVPRYEDEEDKYKYSHPWAYPSEIMQSNRIEIVEQKRLIEQLANLLTKK